MLNKIFRGSLRPAVMLLASAALTMTGCKKGTFDINDVNPNQPSSVSPKYSLSGALVATGSLMFGGNSDFMNTWMGYWAVSGDFTASPTYVTYTITSDNFAGNWDAAYINLKNYDLVETGGAADPDLVNYQAIGKIMKAFVYQRIADLYNAAPYTDALSTTNLLPSYTGGKEIYTGILAQLDSAKLLIAGAPTTAETPDDFDPLFAGDMSLWVKFANTLKLKILMRLTATDEATTKAGLSGLTPDDFLGADEDAILQPGYSSGADNQENPLYLNLGYTSTGANGSNHTYWRAATYAVNFYNTNNDPRGHRFFEVKADSTIKGRALGSTALEHNDAVSGVFGAGITPSADAGLPILGAYESLFLQAEAVQRGYITGTAQDLYESAVTESFRLLGVDDYETAAADYVAQSNQLTTWGSSTDKLRLILTQKWAANCTLDPFESHGDWLRTGIPANIPVSIFPGNTQTHIPYRVLYPTSENSYNQANVAAQGTVDINTKVFFQP